MSGRLPVTLCVNTRNAAHQLADCVRSCEAWVAEVLVADMESEDDTVAVARGLGARVLTLPNAGFAEPGREQAIQAAAQPWVLVLDADERAQPGVEEVARGRLNRAEVAGVWLPRQNILFGRRLRHTGYWPDYQLRLVRRDAVRWPARVHAYPEVDGLTEHAPADPACGLLHHNYARISEWIERNNRYTDIEAARLVAEGRRPSLWRLMSAPPREFLSRYLRHQGFRDGAQGLAVSLLLGLNALMLEAKLWRR